ncbi:hypothetical protein CSKR_114458 [Clonorchis sinensis]|uniref:C2H2-type domain-containing protein n=1 Tax=Clonorchis sinensis TaxID=79923 RepID=A0A3R7EWX3_CLOSI|nr:hypothetical protein CSKR_114458 [Clonorchis sinensis]
MYALGRRTKFHRMVHDSRMSQISVGKIPFDLRAISISLLCLQNLAVAQNHLYFGLGAERNERREISAPQFVPASNSRATPHTHENYGISFEGVVTLKDEEKTTKRADRNSVHQCPVCGKTFRYRGSLMGHQKSHTNHHDFQCSLCSNAYKYTSDLYGHMRAKHAAEITGTYRTSSETVQKSREAGNPCFECNKFFKSWRCLQQHQQLVHKGAGRSLCEECGNIFSQKKILYRHIRNAHKKPVSLTCVECGKSLWCLFALNRHIKSVHKFAPKDESLL